MIFRFFLAVMIAALTVGCEASNDTGITEVAKEGVLEGVDSLSGTILALYEQTLLYDMATIDPKLGKPIAILKTCTSPFEYHLPHLSWLTASYGDHDLSPKNVLRAMQLVLDSGCNINEKQGDGFSPLHEAIILRHPNLVSFLITNGADIKNPVNRPGKEIDQAGSLELAKLLLEKTGDDSYQEIITLLSK